MKTQGYEFMERVYPWLRSIARRLESSRLLRPLMERFRRVQGSQKSRPPEQPAEHADERSIRRMAEAEHGGTSSAESAARYERGENAGGTHQKAVQHEGPVHQRPEFEEPQERKERVPGGERHIPISRKGS
jgi:predicted lipid-binding transport protein (Tim44 family)